LDFHSSARQNLTICFLIWAVGSFEKLELYSDGLDRGLLNTLADGCYSGSASDNEWIGLLGAR